MWKKHKLVMLPTEKAKIYISRITGQLGLYKEEKTYTGESQGRNLHILSDDEIKEGDWCIDLIKLQNIKSNRPLIFKAIVDGDREFNKINKSFKKIIATTDKLEVMTVWDIGIKTMLLPQLPEQFIKHFVEEYNKGNVVSDVLVECRDTITYNPSNMNEISLKVNSDNTINIKTVKNSWSRDEVILLLEEFNDIFGSLSLFGDFKSQDRPKFDKWIEENL